MKSRQLNKSKGFTIIETLIVLAIAATIFLVVFLAVTALNRSSRNTQRKDDAAALMAAISDYVSNNDGALPAVISTGPVTKSAAGPVVNQNVYFCATVACPTNTGDSPATAKVGYYKSIASTANATSGAIFYALSGTPIAVNVAATDTINIYAGTICNGNVATTSGASANSIAAEYGVENGGGSFTWQCIGG